MILYRYFMHMQFSHSFPLRPIIMRLLQQNWLKIRISRSYQTNELTLQFVRWACCMVYLILRYLFQEFQLNLLRMIKPPNPNVNNNNCVILSHFEEEFPVSTPPRKPPRNFPAISQPVEETVIQQTPASISTSTVSITYQQRWKRDEIFPVSKIPGYFEKSRMW